MADGGEHTIVLVQLTAKVESRTWSSFDSVAEACDGIFKLYEARLSQLNPSIREITYTIADLNNFVDNLGDISCLSLRARDGTYIPRDRDWVKTAMLTRLRQLAK
eukprot:c36224_g1_i1.p1 GENE.c36224_g1_i1~~c36224_g1_i1.p1  ORF type:complete len:105 (+),score=23.53 c36224_g1_i1:97-411(+)